MKRKWINDTSSRIYTIWVLMRSRCNNPNHQAFHRYGGRGITICEEWTNSFDDFYAWAMNSGYSDDLTIERIDVDGMYCPENCTWISKSEQAQNRSTSVLVDYNGYKKSCAKLSREAGFKDKHTVLNRIRNGMSINDAMSKPSRKGRLYTINGETGTIAQLAEMNGIKRTTLQSRIRRGMADDKIFKQASAI